MTGGEEQFSFSWHSASYFVILMVYKDNESSSRNFLALYDVATQETTTMLLGTENSITQIYPPLVSPKKFGNHLHFEGQN
jgi:hypothetical protein